MEDCLRGRKAGACGSRAEAPAKVPHRHCGMEKIGRAKDDKAADDARRVRHESGRFRCDWRRPAVDIGGVVYAATAAATL